jgi:hypothetical protein
MKQFREFINRIDTEVGLLSERNMGRPNWIKAVAIAWASNLGKLENDIHASKDIRKKLDLLATQTKLTGYLAAGSIASDINDRTVIGRLRSRK